MTPARPLRLVAFVLTLVVAPGGRALAAGDPVVGDLDSVEGFVEVKRGGEWFEAEVGDELHQGDEVRTDPDSHARIIFWDEHDGHDAEPTVVDLSPETHLAIHDLMVELEGGKPARSGFLEMLRGALHAVAHGWGNDSLFSIKAGTTLCGIRGSAANVAHDPHDDSTAVAALHGEVFTGHAETHEEARAHHHRVRRGLHTRRELLHGKWLEVGHQEHHTRGGERRRRRLDPELFQRVQETVLRHRGRGGHRHARHVAGVLKKVRATGQARRKRRGKRLREAFARVGAPSRRPRAEARRDLLQGMRDRGPARGGLRERIQDRREDRRDRRDQRRQPAPRIGERIRNRMKEKAPRRRRWGR